MVGEGYNVTRKGKHDSTLGKGRERGDLEEVSLVVNQELVSPMAV